MSYATARSALLGLHPSIDEENQTALLVAADAVNTSEDLGAFLWDVDTSETTQVAELFTALAEEICELKARLPENGLADLDVDEVVARFRERYE